MYMYYTPRVHLMGAWRVELSYTIQLIIKNYRTCLIFILDMPSLVGIINI